MQNKSFRNLERQVVIANGQGTLTMQNDSERRENFHGIRAKGRIIIDDTNDGFSSGFITVLCLPQSDMAVPVISDSATMEGVNEMIVAIEPFMVQMPAAGGLAPTQTGGVHDFDIVLQTSRTCSRGGRIVLQVHNDSGSINSIILTCLLTSFRTIV